MNMKHYLLTVLSAAALILTGCDPKDSEPTPEITPTGDGVALFASGIDVPAAATDVTLSFNSAVAWQAKSDVSWVVITPASGKAGDVTVTVSIERNDALESRAGAIAVTSEGITKTVSVRQAARDRILISGVTLDHADYTLYPGETVTLHATVTPSNTDEDKTVTWTSSNEGVATVAEGVVTALAEGEVEITAKAGSFSATCKVTVAHKVVDVASITLSQAQAELYIGETLTLTATVLPENADDKTVVWTSSDEAVATVADGVVTALAVGETVITAKAGAFSATCKIVVYRKGSGGEDMGDPVDTNPWE